MTETLIGVYTVCRMNTLPHCSTTLFHFRFVVCSICGCLTWVRYHIRHITSMCVVISVHMYNFAGLIRRTPPPKISDTAITDRHSDTTHWHFPAWSTLDADHPGLLDRKKKIEHRTLSTRPGASLSTLGQ